MQEAFPPPVIPYLPLVITHIAAGSIAIIAGYLAVTVKKGERLHRAVGTVFVLAMLVMASVATYLAISLQGQLPGQTANIAAGTLVAYLVGTSWVAARRKDGPTGLFEKFALAVALGLSATFVYWGVIAATSPTGKFDGYPPYLYFVFAGVIALFAAMDLKVILRGSTGPQRIARHLSRMCFAFFVAAGSFFIGQQKIMPEWILQARPLLFALGFAPLAFLVFWLIRVRFTKWYKRDAVIAPQTGNSGDIHAQPHVSKAVRQ